MSFLIPRPGPVPPPVPRIDDDESRAAVAATRERERRRRGGLATILTSGRGVAGPAPVRGKTLLGE